VATLLARQTRLREGNGWSGIQEVPRILFLIDCVRYGSDAPQLIRDGVRSARSAWIAGLFPEVLVRPEDEE
jgi:hypothetical protein